MKNKLFSLIYTTMLVLFTIYVLLDAFVIERVYQNAADEPSNDISYESNTESIVTENGYADDNIKITITQHRIHDTTVYVADVVLKAPELLKTAFAKDKVGKNVKEKTSKIAAGKGAILAINGDYYSARTGCVIRNGTFYPDFFGDSNEESLVINKNGSFNFISGTNINAQKLLDNNAAQVFSFGPALVKEGVVSVGEKDEVDKAMRDNPRTAIAWYGNCHYAFIVSDGRTNESAGLTLYELANFISELGATNAYNLDGGGSSTMYFNGKVINNPTTNGKKITEREVSDIVYIGY